MVTRSETVRYNIPPSRSYNIRIYNINYANYYTLSAFWERGRSLQQTIMRKGQKGVGAKSPFPSHPKKIGLAIKHSMSTTAVLSLSPSLKCNLDVSLPTLFITGFCTYYATHILLTRNTLLATLRVIDVLHALAGALFLSLQTLNYLDVSNAAISTSLEKCGPVYWSRFVVYPLFVIPCYTILISKFTFFIEDGSANNVRRSSYWTQIFYSRRTARLASTLIFITSLFASAATSIKSLNQATCNINFIQTLSNPGRIILILLTIALHTTFMATFVQRYRKGSLYDDKTLIMEPTMTKFSIKSQHWAVMVEMVMPIFIASLVSLLFLGGLNQRGFDLMGQVIEDTCLFALTTFAYSSIGNVNEVGVRSSSFSLTMSIKSRQKNNAGAGKEKQEMIIGSPIISQRGDSIRSPPLTASSGSIACPPIQYLR